jgi:hypothetical protein
VIITVVVWWQLFLLKKWTKVGAKLFFFDPEFLTQIFFKRRAPVKMVDLFHGEVVTFVSGFDGIRDIFEARFIMQLCFYQFQYT